MNKTLLLASFIFPERVDWFIKYLNDRFNITKDKIFCYKALEDESKLIITFKLTIKEGEYLNLKEIFPNALIIHKKGSALYTINALNILINTLNPESIGNINNKSIVINWEEYQDKLILSNINHLTFLSISRVF